MYAPRVYKFVQARINPHNTVLPRVRMPHSPAHYDPNTRPIWPDMLRALVKLLLLGLVLWAGYLLRQQRVAAFTYSKASGRAVSDAPAAAPADSDLVGRSRVFRVGMVK